LKEPSHLHRCSWNSPDQGLTKGGTIPQALNHYGPPKSTSNVTSTFFSAVHLFPKDLKFEHGAPNLLLASGAIWPCYCPDPDAARGHNGVCAAIDKHKYASKTYVSTQRPMNVDCRLMCQELFIS